MAPPPWTSCYARGQVRDPHLVRLFLMLHPWYLPPPELARRLRRRLEDSGGSAEGPALHLKIRHLVRYWVRAFPEELEGDPEFLQQLRELGGALGGPGGDPQIFADLERLLQPGGGQEEPPVSVGPTESVCPSVSPPDPASVCPPGSVSPPRRKAALLLERVEPPALAQLLTGLERRVMAAVRPQDFRSFARCGSAACSPALQGAVALSNRVARWVQLLVLTPPTPAQRARVIERFLLTAQSLLELRNFNSLLSVVGGLGHGAVTRLRRTVALLPPDVMQLWSRLADTMSAGGNYRRYRALLGGGGGAAAGGGPGGGGFPLPALGVHLRDLVALEVALPDWAGPERPHAAKLQQRFAILGGLLGAGGPPVSADPELLHLLTVSLELSVSEQQLYQLSLQREPRTDQPAGPPPALPPPAPWVLPDPPRPDPELLRGHLEQLVESLFRQFDVDGDGRISRAEFAIVRGNFPQLRLFGDLDTDGDGGLSRGELLDYFLRCSQGGDGTPPGPPHHFEGGSALRPARCAQCGELILGFTSPGLRCRACGLRCHPRCRERLRLPCRRRTQSVTETPPGATETPPGATETPPAPPRGRSLSLALPWPRRAPPQPLPETPPELQELEDGVFDTHL
ncbi:RAS guanyl-releasing protein 2-like isoform X2 [Patagioenas fasciata]|uniref:RAS guanyl-releasing protein 2-like isoform X2 n=1 Tax=Patagioenas fasciata TaxID=372321 RepID=UPI003A99096D